MSRKAISFSQTSRRVLRLILRRNKMTKCKYNIENKKREKKSRQVKENKKGKQTKF
jgi:hypothetical protein